MPRLAAFPKAYMQSLCKSGEMRVQEWIDLARPLGVDGLEWYSGFLEMQDPGNWSALRAAVEETGMCVPMLCCSPDFTHPDPAFRLAEIEKEKGWLKMASAMGASYCRVLSGQRRPEISIEEGIAYTVDSIGACLPLAEEHGITLIMENHYKDDFWSYPEFAQKMDIFCEIVARIDHPNFGVNYDPSNTFLAGEDPLELLRRVADRVVTMHASDRYLAEGTLDDLRREETGAEGYAKRLRHGQIGEGLNDYDAIFGILKSVGFNGWISIEDGVDGIDQLARSAEFLKARITQFWGEN
ncbi:MAG: sugar phosphate isomerase/epimerase [Verrucomicrobiales bacterium]|jgi:sugar phosphate isomerase/epimerase